MSSKKYIQKFRKSWLDRDELKEWLIENSNMDDNPKYGGYCVYCNISLPSKLYDLQSHAASRKHCRNVNEKAKIEAVEYKLLSSLNLPDVCRVGVVKTDFQRRIISNSPVLDEKEDIFGKYIASELKLIKNSQIYEEVKVEIINTLQTALNSQSDLDDFEE